MGARVETLEGIKVLKKGSGKNFFKSFFPTAEGRNIFSCTEGEGKYSHFFSNNSLQQPPPSGIHSRIEIRVLK